MNDCFLRQFMRLHNVPLPRVEIDDDNPYKTTAFTQDQLNMRRKVEILKYSANKSSSQANRLTRKQLFAMAMRGNRISVRPDPNGDLAPISCPNDDYLPTPSSSAGVPGPVVILQNNPDVPLYLYATNIRTFPDYVPNDDRQWRLLPATDASFVHLTEQIQCVLLIYREIEDPVTVYNLTVPVGLDVQGVCLPNTTSPFFTKTAAFTASINYVVLTIYFGGNVVTSVRHPPASSGTTTGLQMVVDLSDNAAGGPFRARSFVGNVGFLGLSLPTVMDFVYEFRFLYSLSFRTDDPQYVANNYFATDNQLVVIGNMTPGTDVVQGCRLLSSTGSGQTNAGLVFVKA